MFIYDKNYYWIRNRNILNVIHDIKEIPIINFILNSEMFEESTLRIGTKQRCPLLPIYLWFTN